MSSPFFIDRALICRCAHRRLLPAEALERLRGRLRAAGVPVVEVADLCGLAARGDGVLAPLFASERVLIGACHDRAVRWLLAGAGVVLPPSARLVDLRADSAAAALAEAAFAASPGSGNAEFPPVPEEAADAWFPVIDRDRCVDCGKCFDFCLFGAYAREDSGEITVVQPDACKDNCPACARICPANAIIFPKSTDEAINGARLDPGALRGARIRLRPEDMLRGDVYSRLKARMSAARRRGPLFRPGVLPEPGETPPASCPFAEPPGGEEEP